MGHRLSRIVTRTGDDGTTGLGDGRRVPKDAARIEAGGSVDELNCALGVLLAHPSVPTSIASCLIETQHDLFDLGGELSIPGSVAIGPAQVQRLEDVLEALNAELPPLKEFVLPGGGSAASACHFARAVCRRSRAALLGARAPGTGRRRRAALSQSPQRPAVRDGARAGAPGRRQRAAVAPRSRPGACRHLGELAAQPRPVERRARVGLASRRDVTVPDHALAAERRQGRAGGADHAGQRRVLGIRVRRRRPCPRARCRWRNRCRPGGRRSSTRRHARRARRRARTAPPRRRAGSARAPRPAGPPTRAK